MDIVFVHPSDRFENYQALGESIAAIEPPVWCGMLAEYARRKGLGVAVLDMDAEQMSTADVAKSIGEIHPLLVAIVVYGQHPSASTQNMPATERLCTQIKLEYPRQHILLVGGHIAALPEHTLRTTECDFTCSGEGMVTLVELVEALKTNSPLDRISDLWYRDGNTIQKSESRASLLRSLDVEMPTLAWDLLPMNKYRAHNWQNWADTVRKPYVSVYTTLGCSFHCHFCCIQAPFKSGEAEQGLKSSVNSYRMWSPLHVVNTLEMLVEKYGVHYVKFADEMFVLNPRHVIGICEGIIERRLDLNIWAYARVDTTRPQWLDLLRKAGVRWLALGVESASTKVRDNVQKGFDQDDIRTCIDRVQQADIYVGANYIFGLPEDNLSTMQETLDLACEINAENSNFYSTMFYPGSQLFTDAVKAGLPVSYDWREYAQLSEHTRVMDTRHVSGAEVLRFRDNAFRHYFTRLEYLSMIENKFGTNAVENIKDMNAIMLKRRYA